MKRIVILSIFFIKAYSALAQYKPCCYGENVDMDKCCNTISGGTLLPYEKRNGGDYLKNFKQNPKSFEFFGEDDKYLNQLKFIYEFKPRVYRGIPNGDTMAEKFGYKRKKHMSLMKQMFSEGVYTPSNDRFTYNISRKDSSFYTNDPIPKFKLSDDSLRTLEYFSRYFLFPMHLLDSIDLSLGIIGEYDIKFSALFDNDGSFRKLYLVSANIDTNYLSDSARYLNYLRLNLCRNSVIRNSIQDSFLKSCPPIYFELFKYQTSMGHIPQLGFILNRENRKFFRTDFVSTNYRDTKLHERLFLQTGRYIDLFHKQKMFDTTKLNEYNSINKNTITTEIPTSIEHFFQEYQGFESKFEAIMPGFMDKLRHNLQKMKIVPRCLTKEDGKHGYGIADASIMDELTAPIQCFGTLVTFSIGKQYELIPLKKEDMGNPQAREYVPYKIRKKYSVGVH